MAKYAKVLVAAITDRFIALIAGLECPESISQRGNDVWRSTQRVLTVGGRYAKPACRVETAALAP